MTRLFVAVIHLIILKNVIYSVCAKKKKKTIQDNIIIDNITDINSDIVTDNNVMMISL